MYGLTYLGDFVVILSLRGQPSCDAWLHPGSCGIPRQDSHRPVTLQKFYLVFIKKLCGF